MAVIEGPRECRSFTRATQPQTASVTLSNSSNLQQTMKHVKRPDRSHEGIGWKHSFHFCFLICFSLWLAASVKSFSSFLDGYSLGISGQRLGRKSCPSTPSKISKWKILGPFQFHVSMMSMVHVHFFGQGRSPKELHGVFCHPKTS